MKYRKKPVIVEAFRFTDDVEMIVPEWFTQAVIDEKILIDRSLVDGHMHIYGCTINTKGGRMHAKIGDYIIRERNGNLHSCRADAFKKTYEKAGGAA